MPYECPTRRGRQELVMRTNPFGVEGWNGADINAKNNEGLTALQMASQKGHQSTIKLLREGT